MSAFAAAVVSALLANLGPLEAQVALSAIADRLATDDPADLRHLLEAVRAQAPELAAGLEDLAPKGPPCAAPLRGVGACRLAEGHAGPHGWWSGP